LCERSVHGVTPVPATRLVHLTSKYVDIVRAFCDACAAELCAPDRPADTLQGADMGPLESN
jgi:hypothetical protein